MSNSKISIIIPNYNNAKWLPLCLDSCLMQYGDFELEVIVVDDHSTDKSWEVIQAYQKEFPEIIKATRNPEKGGNQARNYGFSISTGDYIQWLDSDDFILPNKIQQQISILESNSNVDIVYSDWRMDFYEDSTLDKEVEIIEGDHDDFLYKLLQNEWLPPLSYLLKKDVALKLDLLKAWNPNTQIGQDREYFTLAAIIGANFKYVSGVFSVYNRWSKATVSNRMDDEKRSKEVIKLNNRFYREIVESEMIINKQKYLNVLNAELLRILFYHPGLSIQRRFYFWQVDPARLHWKQRLIIPYLYLIHLIRK